MSDSTEKRLAWYLRLILQAILLTGTAFYILPLVWMIATSLKPLDETLKVPHSLEDVFVGTGHEATIDGTTYPVTLERTVEPTPDKPMYIVRATESFSAGELILPFGPETWEKYPVFSRHELEKMNTVVAPGMSLLADERNRFDPDRSVLKLMSGHEVQVELVGQVLPADDNQVLWLVREWRPEDTDTKEVGATAGDVRRAWDVLADDQIREVARFIPRNYPVALRKTHFMRSLGNTLFLCVMTVSGTVISSVLVAYGFAFLEFRGRDIIFAITLATMMIPFVVVMTPVYLLYRKLGWVGTFKPLWVTTWFGSAFFIFLLRQFFLGLPRDLVDAARIDGCSHLEILWNVVVPLSRPAIAMVALFTFLGTWKDFLGPLIYLNHESQFTLSLSLQAFASEHGGTPWHLLMAASTVFSLPLIVLFFLTMKTFIRGIAMTGIKG